jgi:hypothetical protein
MSTDPKKPYHHVYKRNRFSKSLSLHSRNHRDIKDARKEMTLVRQAAGHDYTFKISSTWGPL